MQIDQIRAIGGLSLEACAGDDFEKMILRDMSRLLNADGAVFFHMQGDMVRPRFGGEHYLDVDPIYGGYYCEYYHQMDPCMNGLIKRHSKPFHAASISTMQAIDDINDYTNSQYYNEFLRPQNIHTSLIFMLADEAGLLGLAGFQRPPKAVSFNREAHEIVSLIAPYLVYALQKRRHHHAAAEKAAKDTAGGPTGLKLTKRQEDIIKMVANGRTNKEIAHHLGISVKTIEHHLTNIYQRTGLHNRVELARLVLGKGFPR